MNKPAERSLDINDMIQENKEWISELKDLHAKHRRNGKFRLSENIKDLITHRQAYINTLIVENN